MKILHLAAHMGDGVGKAIGGIARTGLRYGDEHAILLFDEPKKLNHIEKCKKNGIPLYNFYDINNAIKAILWADVAVLNWWGVNIPINILKTIDNTPTRLLLWTHQNGFFKPPLSQPLVDSCDGLLVTTPFSFENPSWCDATLVIGCGEFSPASVNSKTNYDIAPTGEFKIGYVGMPGYKRFPKNACDYYIKTAEKIPKARFIFIGEYDPIFHSDMKNRGLLDKCDFLGWVNNVPDLLLTFDTFASLLYEKSSAACENAVLEAMAAGLPIVMSEKPVGKYFVGESAGLLAQSPETYADALLKFYNDKALRQSCGMAARQKVIADCDPKKNYARYKNACMTAMCREKKQHSISAVY